MGYVEDAMAELHKDRIRDSTPPTIQEAHAKESEYLGAKVLLEVAKELERARATHAPMNSHHEGYTVILEELDELWEVCKMNTHKFGSEAAVRVEQRRLQTCDSDRGNGNPIRGRRLR